MNIRHAGWVAVVLLVAPVAAGGEPSREQQASDAYMTMNESRPLEGAKEPSPTVEGEQKAGLP